MDGIVFASFALGVLGIAIPIVYTGMGINKTLSSINSSAKETATMTKNISETSTNKLMGKAKEGNLAQTYSLCLAIRGALENQPVSFEEILKDGSNVAQKILHDEIDSEVKIRLGTVSVEDIMTRHDQLVVVNEGDTVEKIFDLILKEKHMGYPVFDKNEYLKGIITLHDILKIKKEDWGKTKARSAMTHREKLIIAHPSDPAIDAINKMEQKKIGRLPVLEQDMVVGIISRSDCLQILDKLKAS